MGVIGVGGIVFDFQYKMLFPIGVRGGTPHLQCFSVYLPF